MPKKHDWITIAPAARLAGMKPWPFLKLAESGYFGPLIKHEGKWRVGLHDVLGRLN